MLSFVLFRIAVLVEVKFGSVEAEFLEEAFGLAHLRWCPFGDLALFYWLRLAENRDVFHRHPIIAT